jgi:hypothetical protein
MLAKLVSGMTIAPLLRSNFAPLRMGTAAQT